ncbi:MAG TPA: PKD domain-containing protein, partial [Bacteroidota bacterium]|nr:PKD domain-containing protein [Bacteroidota bacterium]
MKVESVVLVFLFTLTMFYGCSPSSEPIELPSVNTNLTRGRTHESSTTNFAGVLPVGVPVYAVKALTTPAPYGIATGVRVNQSGDVVGWSIANFPAEPILVTPENGVIVLPTSTSQHYGIARDLSDRMAGVITVVGEARLSSTSSAIHAVRWRVAVPQGSVVDVTDLGVLPDHFESSANAVNGAGQIVGTSDPSSSLSIRSFIHTDAGGMMDIGLGAIGANAVARDVNASGLVTGYLGLRAFRWSASGGYQSLGAPVGWADAFGYAINANGQVAGTAGAASGNAEVIVRYTDGSGWKILGGTGQHNQGSGINQWGDVVGTGIAGTGGLRRGVLYTDNLRLLAFVDDLLLDLGSWKIMEAYDINDAQQITGRAINNQTGLSSAVLLTPVSPPPPNQAPLANFTHSCTASLFCNFDGSGSTDDRGILAWDWTVNGQSIGTGKFLGVQYSTPQIIKVSLTVTDSRGATNSITKEVVIGEANQPPIADASATPASGPAPLTVNF